MDHYILNPDKSTTKVSFDAYLEVLTSDKGKPFEEKQGHTRVLSTHLPAGTVDLSGSDIHISTVFLGLNHQYGEGKPLLFETMVFGLNDGDDMQDRYSTWNEAVDGHLRTIGLVVLKLQGEEPQYAD